MRSRLLGSLLVGFGVAVLVVIAAIPIAEASPRFTVANKSDKKLNIRIYNGDDGDCSIPLKTETANSKVTHTHGCQGNGKGRCKIKINHGTDKICKSLQNTCGDRAIIMKDDSLVYIYSTPTGYDCQIQ